MIVYFIIPILAVVALAALMIIFKVTSDNLRRKFVGMGNIVGKTYQEIKSVVGESKLVNYTSDGTVRTWQKMQYKIQLKFKFDENKNEICDGTVDEKMI